MVNRGWVRVWATRVKRFGKVRKIGPKPVESNVELTDKGMKFSTENKMLSE